MLRKVFFWLHLGAGSLAGIVILMMCLTGVLLAWQRQIVHWADRGFRHAPAGEQSRLAPERLLTNLLAAGHPLPTGLTMRSDPEEPVAAEYGRESVVYLNPWTGEVLGPGSRGIRNFFRETENWHRWLAAGLESRATARGITGLANLLFLGLLLSGLYLWLPKKWGRSQVRTRVWFQRGQSGRSRDWNWHHTIGAWCAAPLLVIVLSGVVMSYPWANALVYRITGTEMPAPSGGPGRGGRGRAESPDAAARMPVEGLDSLWLRAGQQMPGWKSITMRMPSSAKGPVQFQLDEGDGGRPDLRAQLTLNRQTGEVVRWEPFSGNNAGRRLRSWIRFAHTGEAGGVPGETVAAIASLGAAVLVWTGLSLALRRLRRAVDRRRAQSKQTEVAA